MNYSMFVFPSPCMQSIMGPSPQHSAKWKLLINAKSQFEQIK